MDQRTKEAIQEYYKLKTTYEDKQQRAKRKILQDESLDKKSKRIALSKLKNKCVNCGKLGGTLFVEKNNTLRALCEAETKCDLNMNIYRGSYSPFFPLYNKLNKESESIRTNIVKTKLDLLFSYTTEETAILQFQEYRKEFNTIEEELNRLHSIYISIIKNMRNKNAITESTKNMDLILNRISLMLQEYKETHDSMIMYNIIQEYINELLPEAKLLRENMYAQNEVEKEEDKYLLYQESYLYSETEVSTI